MQHNSKSRVLYFASALLICIGCSGIATLAALAARVESPGKAGNVSKAEEDITLIVGGHFTPDALGPDVYDAVVARAKGHADAYLDVFESMYLGPKFDAELQSRLYLPSFLQLVYTSSPDRTRQAASRLLKQYDAILVVYDNASDKQALFKLLPDETVRLLQRLDIRRKELQELLPSPK